MMISKKHMAARGLDPFSIYRLYRKFHPHLHHCFSTPLHLRIMYQCQKFSADCDTDHSLVGCKIRILPKKFHRSKQEGKQMINVSKTQWPELSADFTSQLSASSRFNYSLPAAEQWEILRDVTHKTALDVFGKKKGNKQNDWFEANSEQLTPLIEAKRKALQEYKDHPSDVTLKSLRSARRIIQKAVRTCTNVYWTNLCQSIQQAADTGNIKGMYDGIKKAIGPCVQKTAPLKSKTGEIITNKADQLHRWVEHYAELYSKENSVHQTALDAIDELPMIAELDNAPTIEELSKAIDKLPTGKAPGKDCIPAEVVKCGKPGLLEPLHKLLTQCWEEGAVPQDMRDANIITLYKNKGDRSDCNNYRGISLLSIVGKLFARIVLNRLQILADRIYPESQCGLRSKRSTVDMIFSLRQLQEKCREQNQPLYIAFIDLTKAFDLVSRDGLFKMLPKIGCPPKLLSIIRSFHDGMMSTVQFDGDTSEEFGVKSGVKQGCVLAPTLFGIFFALLLKHAFRSSEEGVYLHSRSDGQLFNLSRLRAKTKIRKVLIRDLLFADDAAVASHTVQGLQNLMDRFSDSCDLFGLTISQKKTQVMSQTIHEIPVITVNGEELEVVHQFQYLGSTASDTLSLDVELNKRIGKASSTLSRLSKRVWENRHLTLPTKMTAYKACVLSTLLYGSESWTTYAHQEKKLQVFHLRCLRRILGIKWQDKITNNDVLSKAGLPSMFTLLRQRRLRWVGHVYRMEDGRIPKDILYGELATGARNVGRPQLRYKDVVMRDMKVCKIPPGSWESTAGSRTIWKQQVAKGLKASEMAEREKNTQKRVRRKARQSQTDRAPETSAFTCQDCSKVCRSRIGLYSHRRRCSSAASQGAYP